MPDCLEVVQFTSVPSPSQQQYGLQPVGMAQHISYGYGLWHIEHGATSTATANPWRKPWTIMHQQANSSSQH
eukprot:6010874-Pleurochrysis_carterae.AAC.1